MANIKKTKGIIAILDSCLDRLVFLFEIVDIPTTIIAYDVDGDSKKNSDWRQLL